MNLKFNSGVIDTGFVYIAQIFIILSGIAVQSCLAWFLGPSDRGAYAVCMVFGYVIGIFSCLGIDGALQYNVASKKIPLSQIISLTLTLCLFCSILGLTVGTGLLNLDLEFFRKAPMISYIIALLYIPVSIMDAVITKLLIGLREFKSIGVFALIKGVLNFTFIVFFVYIFSIGLNGAVFAIIIAWTITVVFECLYIYRKYHFQLVLPQKKNILKILHYGRRFYFIRLGNIMNFHIGTVIIAFFLSASDIGYYVVATKLVAYVIIVPDGLANVLLPRIAASTDGKANLVIQCSRLCGVICGTILIFMMILIKPLVLILFSASFLPIIPLVWVLVPGIFLRCMTKILISYFNGINRPEISSSATIAGVIVNLIFLSILVPFMGTMGGAIAISIGYSVNAVILLTSFITSNNTSLSSFLGLRKSDILFVKKNIGLKM